ncbi:MAG: pilus assembly protein [Acidimicrobiia bacterium]|nr:pilus assembly protein [Acidimicrobiia bacterium]
MLTRARKRDGEQGAALVEMAIVLPILVLLVFGIIEFGMAFNKRLTIGNATQSAARVATAVANNKYADITALRTLEQGLISLPNNGRDVIKSVWIYKAAPDGSPADCGGPCINKYTYSYNPFDPTACKWTPCPDPDVPPAETFKWDPEKRNATVGNLDVLGVRVYFSHKWITGAVPILDVKCELPPAGCWADTAIMRLEPQQLGVG